ncbi:hypothetical protein [Microvirga sp. 2TAF3]|uniref:hypothetical protein n=1 Tax=Microvirga sp. 2TAF3 TaxID=3233014 RepID=UPI003F9E9C82
MGALLFATSLFIWLGVVATWQPGPIPEDFFELRNRWEFGHIIIATIKLAGYMAIVLSILLSRLRALRNP